MSLPSISLFSDMMFPSTVFRRANVHKYMPQTLDGLKAFPMASRSEAHETLSLLVARDDVPSACICDNAKEMIQRKFY